VKFGIICGFTSVILVMLLGQSRVFYSMSRDGLVPAVFSDIHPKFHTPWRSNMLFFFFVAPFSAFLPLSIVGHMTSIGTLFAFVIVCAGVWVMRVKKPDAPRPFKTPLVRWCRSWHRLELRDDVFAGLVQLVAADRLAGHRPGDLLHLQPDTQPLAEGGPHDQPLRPARGPPHQCRDRVVASPAAGSTRYKGARRGRAAQRAPAPKALRNKSDGQSTSFAPPVWSNLYHEG